MPYKLQPGEKRKYRVLTFSEVAQRDGKSEYSSCYVWDTDHSMIGITDFPVGHSDPLYLALVVDQKVADKIVEAMNLNEEMVGGI